MPSTGRPWFSSSLLLVGSSSRRALFSSRLSSDAGMPAVYSSAGGGDADRFPDLVVDCERAPSEGARAVGSAPSTGLKVFIRLALFAALNGDLSSDGCSSGSASRERVRAGAALLAISECCSVLVVCRLFAGYSDDLRCRRRRWRRGQKQVAFPTASKARKPRERT